MVAGSIHRQRASRCGTRLRSGEGNDFGVGARGVAAENPAPYPPNWRPEFVMAGAGIRPAKALQIADEVARKYDRA